MSFTITVVKTVLVYFVAPYIQKVIVLVLDDKTIKRIFYMPLIAMRRKDMAWDFFIQEDLK